MWYLDTAAKYIVTQLQEIVKITGNSHIVIFKATTVKYKASNMTCSYTISRNKAAITRNNVTIARQKSQLQEIHNFKK